MIYTIVTNRLGGYNGLRKRFSDTNSIYLKKLYAFINRGFERETNSYLPFDTVIEGPLNFLHGTYGIFISGSAKIGKNCTLYQQVTIGSNMLVDSKGLGSPTIGDNCLIGAGAKIIGNIKIGNNCRIGANTVVTKDLSDNAVIVLGAPVVIQKEALVNTIYQYRTEGWGYIKDGVFIKETDSAKIEKLNATKQ